ncbi:Uncharacterized protein APZ42_004335, partial [Daphnia magna]
DKETLIDLTENGTLAGNSAVNTSDQHGSSSDESDPDSKLSRSDTQESDNSENAAPEEDEISKGDQSSGPIEQVKSKDIPSSESEKVLKGGVTRKRRRETTTNKQVHVKSGNKSALKRSQASLVNISELQSKIKMNSTSKKQKLSRSDIRKRSMMRLGANDLYQTYIPNHFKVIDEIILLSMKNDLLSQRLKDMIEESKKQSEFFSFRETNENFDMNPMSLLKRMMTQAIQQSGKKKKGRRYKDQVLSDFSVNIWILGGRHTYE